MFTINILETISIATTIMVCILFALCSIDILSNIDNSFIKLKTERDQMATKIHSLEKELEELKNTLTTSNETNKTNTGVNGRPTSGEINNILVSENRKLHVRCDMLEEELRKTRDQIVINKKSGISN